LLGKICRIDRSYYSGCPNLPIIFRLCLKTRSGFERLVFRMAASPPEADIDDKTNIACFAVFARRKNARSRADDGVFRQSLCAAAMCLFFDLLQKKLSMV